MDDSERIAEQYLIDLDLGAVVFEPDGNIPPDFSLDARIGIEVRRLNQNYQQPDGKHKGLEELAIPLIQRLKRLLVSIGPSVNDESWFVSIDSHRPIGSWKPLKTKIKQKLIAFMESSTRSQTTLQVTQNFELSFIRASKDHGTFFLLGAYSDDDSGGWVMSEVERNLRICISEKERKIKPHRNKYSEWWPILPDHIDYSMESEDRKVFNTNVMPNISHSFNKIILIDPRNYHRAFELTQPT